MGSGRNNKNAKSVKMHLNSTLSQKRDFCPKTQKSCFCYILSAVILQLFLTEFLDKIVL